jgi:hypothetical protein
VNLTEEEMRNLASEALRVRSLAYVPYCKYPVGAALLTADDRVFAGCNVDNASTGLGMCAERVSPARSNREFPDVDAIASRLELALTEGNLRRVASMSYRHDNGFVKILLGDQPDGSAWRLHVWEGMSGPSNIHSHRWDFTSRVLVGSLFVEEFDATVGSDLLAYEFESHEHGRGYSLRKVGAASVQRLRFAEQSAGELSGLSFRELHRVTPACRFVSTFVRTAPSVSRTTKVYSIDNLSGRYEKASLGVDECAAIVARVLRELGD